MKPDTIDWNHLSVVGVLATIAITLAALHDSHAGEALAGLLGFVVSGNRVRPVAVAATLGLAGIVALSGCGVPIAAIVKPSCAAARLVAHTCDLVDPMEVEHAP